MHHFAAYETPGEKAWSEPFKDATSSLRQILEAAPHKTADTQPPGSQLKNHLSKTNRTCLELLEKQGKAKFHNEHLHMKTPVLANQHILTFISLVQTLGAL